MEVRRQDLPLLISIRSQYEEIDSDQDEVLELPSMQEIKDCIRIVDRGGRLWTQRTTCGLITIFMIIATCLAFADAIRRIATCPEDDEICKDRKTSEIILAVMGLVISSVSMVTTCNIRTNAPTLALLSEEKFNKICALGRKLDLEIDKEHALYQVANILRRKERLYLDRNSVQAQHAVGLFAKDTQVKENPADTLEIVVVSPNAKTIA